MAYIEMNLFMFAGPTKMYLCYEKKPTVSTGSSDGNLFPYNLLLYCVKVLREQMRQRTENQTLLAKFCQRSRNRQPMSGASVQEWYSVIGN